MRVTASSTPTAWRSRISRRSAPGAITTKTPRRDIDPRSEFSGGRPVDGPVALREALLARDDQFVQALTEKLMMYALGRELEHYDMPQVRAVVRAAQKRGLSVFGARRRRRAERRFPPAGRAAANRCAAQAALGTRPPLTRKVEGSHAMFLTKKHLSRRTVLKAAGVSLALAVARRDDSRAHGACADGRRAEAARRFLLFPARRDHVEHAVRRRDRRVGRRAAPAPISS